MHHNREIYKSEWNKQTKERQNLKKYLFECSWTIINNYFYRSRLLTRYWYQDVEFILIIRNLFFAFSWMLGADREGFDGKIDFINDIKISYTHYLDLENVIVFECNFLLQ